jgi:hypothetical protein
LRSFVTVLVLPGTGTGVFVRTGVGTNCGTGLPLLSVARGDGACPTGLGTGLVT